MEQLEWHNKHEKIPIPTLYASQILSNTKQMYSTIQEFLQDEDINRIFSIVLNDITMNFLGFFLNLKIEGKTEALRSKLTLFRIIFTKLNRVKEELDYFYKSLLEMPFISLLEDKRLEFEKMMNNILTQNCNNFIEMTSLN